MRLIRGTGLRGLGGIHPRVEVEDESDEVCGEIVRPLLRIRRAELESYLHSLGQAWREDSTNLGNKHTRNRVRKLLLPLIAKEFNPAVGESLPNSLRSLAAKKTTGTTRSLAGWEESCSGSNRIGRIDRRSCRLERKRVTKGKSCNSTRS